MVDKPLLSLAQLQSVCMTANGRQACAQYLAPLNAAMQRYQIDTPIRTSMFLAQIAHESGDFTSVSEGLNYSADGLANTWPSRFGVTTDVGKYLKVPLKGAMRIVPTSQAERLARQPERIANVVYAGRYGNGDEASGDGWRYRGAGLKQLTFKANHEAFGKAIDMPLVKVPDYLRTPEGAALSAAWFWHTNGLNALADARKFEQITQRINGGQIGASSRAAYLERSKKALAA